MTTISALITRRERATPHILAHAALRYDALAGMSPEQFKALHKSAILHHAKDETFEEAFGRIVDVAILTNAADERQQL